ncbi:hypothetical protein MMC30_002623 [Trapelia coarctata]|nr:hypothetical protein [Trapelia coarctata]
MASNTISSFSAVLPILCLLLLFQAAPAAAFGAGNIASISKIEGINWRHGDIEDMLKTLAFIHGHKWTSMMIKRVYFGNWLRDYSQAVDVGTLKGVQSDTIRILVWVLSFLTFGYATEEFEVTEERLGTYRPEEHIDNPRDYADNLDARQYDPRLRPPVQPIELQIDLNTGMKNYIANENLGIATSSGYVKYSFARSIHFGRVYTSGSGGSRHQDADLYEALRCLGQGLHCLEDFGAHTNYTELALRELGYRDVFPHTGTMTEMHLRGKRVYPLVTGTFGAVDFLMSVLGEAQDHFTQTEISEVDKMNIALKDAQAQEASGAVASRNFVGGNDGGAGVMTGLLKQIPGAGSLVQQAEELERASQAQARMVGSTTGQGTYQDSRATQPNPAFQAPPGSVGGPPGPGIPGMSPNFDPKKVATQIYPILEFRDKVVKLVSATIEKIPGLEALVEKITETVTLFVLSLLAPFIRPIIEAVSKQLKAGSTSVVDASGKHQYEPWTDPHCTDPTHSMLSKDHFSNILNEPAGQVASTILQYVAPRIIYAWEHPDIPVDQVLNDIIRVFHHPALRDHHCQLHNDMFAVVERWAHAQPNRGAALNDILSSEGVKSGKNSPGDNLAGGHNHGGLPAVGNMFGSTPAKKEATGKTHVWQESTTAPWQTSSRDGAGTAEALGVEYPGTETAYDTRTNTAYEHSPDPQQTYGYGAPPQQGEPSQGQHQQPGGHYPAYGAGDGQQYGSQGGGAPAPGYGSGAWGER